MTKVTFYNYLEALVSVYKNYFHKRALKTYKKQLKKNLIFFKRFIV